MQVETNKVVSFHYSLSEDGAGPLENSYDDHPPIYLHGHNSMLSGLEEAMEGKQAGDKFSATLKPYQAYGERHEDAKQRIPIKHVATKGKLTVGMPIIINTKGGEQRQATILKVGRFNIDVDKNHPYAGKTLVFDVEVIDVRDASAEELEHGHVHGVGGHQH